MVKLGKITFGGNNPFVLIAGPCVIESRRSAFTIAERLKATRQHLLDNLVIETK